MCYHVANHAHTVSFTGPPQKKGLSPDLLWNKIKYVKGVSCVSPCLFAPLVHNVPNVVKGQSVGGRLQKFWHIWQEMGANPRVVSVLRDGYTLPFKQRPPLRWSPLIQSGYANPSRNRSLKEALLTLIDKLVVERVVVKSSLAFYNRLFLVPKPNIKWRPILDLSQLNLYLSPGTFKMETPETIRLSLQKGEWVTSLDFSDAYFHIPISQRSRKYLRFFLNSRTFHFTALPFGLATAPLEFTKVIKEVKLMAQTKGIQIHQYLDDWLLRAPCPETCQQLTQTLLDLCRSLGWVVNMEKSELTPQQDFNFVGYQFDLMTGRVLPTQDRWTTLQEKLHSQAIHVFDRTAYGNGETSVGRSSSHEAFSMAPKAALACSRNSRKSYSVTPISPSAPRLVVGQEQCPLGTTVAPLQHALKVFTDASNEGWGAHLGDSTARGVWSNTESHLHINLTVKSCSSGPQEFRASLQGPDCAHSNGQHNCSLLHQQRGRYEIRLSLCPPLETSVLVSPQRNSAEGSTHTR